MINLKLDEKYLKRLVVLFLPMELISDPGHLLSIFDLWRRGSRGRYHWGFQLDRGSRCAGFDIYELVLRVGDRKKIHSIHSFGQPFISAGLVI